MQDEIAKLSDKVNMSVREVVGWSHALDLAGASQEALLKSSKTLAAQMFDASSGLKESQRNFKALGIEITNQDGSLRSVNSMLLEVADKYASASNKTEALALMSKVLGKSATDLIPAFKGGREELEKLIAEGQRLNPVTEESAR